MDGLNRDEMLLQDYYAQRGEYLELLISCILLNQTSRKQVDTILDRVVKYMNVSSTGGRAESYAEMIRPLGLWQRRSVSLANLKPAFTELEKMFGHPSLWSWELISDLPGCGEYAAESWRIFVNGDTNFTPNDKELLKYVQKDPMHPSLNVASLA